MRGVQIQNVVAVASLGQRIDLPSITKVFVNVEQRPKFPGLVFRLKRPKTATIIFRSGKMVCSGAKSKKEACSAVKKVVRELKKAGFIILGEPEITIQNIVASSDVGGEVDLERSLSILDSIMRARISELVIGFTLGLFVINLGVYTDYGFRIWIKSSFIAFIVSSKI